MRLVVRPLAYVRVTLMAFPDTVPVLLAVKPLTIIGVIIGPSVQTFAIDFAVLIVAQILTAI